MRRVEFAAPALRQIDELLRVTNEQFGPAAVERYRRLIEAAIRDLADDPDRSGSKPVAAQPGLTLYRLRHSRGRVFGETVQRPRHFIAFTLTDDALRVQQVLHDAMDLPARLTDDLSDQGPYSIGHDAHRNPSPLGKVARGEAA